jgi:hypothetical protein
MLKMYVFHPKYHAPNAEHPPAEHPAVNKLATEEATTAKFKTNISNDNNPDANRN